MFKIFKLHIKRCLLESVNLLFNHDWFYRLVGLVNKRINLIESLFLVYPATGEYALHYFYPHMIRRHVWRPGPSGLLWQNGKLSIMFAISATNGQFTDSQNVEHLRQIADHMEKLRLLLGARRKTFAGTLPGILYYRRIIREAPEADLTAQVVSMAINLVKFRESLGAETPVIILGGKGFIGRRVVKLLGKDRVYSLDVQDGQNQADWPDNLTGKRVIVVNITLNSALRDYIDLIWPGTVVINEVYPEPEADILERLDGKDCNCYHIVGVQGSSLPSFPAAYEGAIPCCAAWPSLSMGVVVQKLN